MPKLFAIIVLLFSTHVSYSQIKGSFDCSIEIYLLKKSYPMFDPVSKRPVSFMPILSDLEDTAFIKNSELVSYTIEKYSMNNKGSKRHSKQIHVAEYGISVEKRMEMLNLPVRQVRQFALVINGQIVYGGCFIDKHVSLAPLGVNAFVSQNEISFQYGFKGSDPRNSRQLIECLKKTNRLTIIDNKYGG